MWVCVLVRQSCDRLVTCAMYLCQLGWPLLHRSAVQTVDGWLWYGYVGSWGHTKTKHRYRWWWMLYMLLPPKKKQKHDLCLIYFTVFKNTEYICHNTAKSTTYLNCTTKSILHGLVSHILTQITVNNQAPHLKHTNQIHMFNVRAIIHDTVINNKVCKRWAELLSARRMKLVNINTLVCLM